MKFIPSGVNVPIECCSHIWYKFSTTLNDLGTKLVVRLSLYLSIIMVAISFGFSMVSQHFVTCWWSLLPTTSFSFALSLLLSLVGFCFWGRQCPNNLTSCVMTLSWCVMRFEIQIAGFILVFRLWKRCPKWDRRKMSWGHETVDRMWCDAVLYLY